MAPVPAEDRASAKWSSKANIAIALTQKERANAIANQHWEPGEVLFHGAPDADRIKAMSDYVRGDINSVPEKWRDFFRKSEQIYKDLAVSEKFGAEIEYEVRKNYWPMAWKEKDLASRVGGATAQGKAANFRRAKAFEDPQEGIDYGLTPVTTNPAVLGAMRHEAGNNAIGRIVAMYNLRDVGLAIREDELPRVWQGEGPNAKQIPHKLPAMEGWQPVDVGGHRWLTHPTAASALYNAMILEQKSLLELAGFDPRSGVVKAGNTIYDNIIRARNMTIPIKLSLSAFHALHVLSIQSFQQISSVLHQMANRRIDLNTAWKLLADTSSIGSYAHGHAAGDLFHRPPEHLAPYERDNINLMVAGGFNPQQPSIYEVRAGQAFRRLMHDAIPSMHQAIEKEGNVNILSKAWKVSPAYAKAAALQIAHGIEAMQHPLFGNWIPALKTAAYLNEAKLLLYARPDLLQGTAESTNQLRIELNNIRKSMDNRFGEMQYTKEFIPRLLRAATQASFLSVGWNLGVLREFGGGHVVDVPKTLGIAATNPFRKTKIQNEISTRTVYASVYLAGTVMIGGILHYLLTGEPPKEMKDYIYPGKEGERKNTMFFSREYGAMYYHYLNEGLLKGSENLIAGKMAPMFGSMGEIIANRDYYGRQIYDPNANPFEQTKQMMLHFGVGTLSPISIQAALSGKITEPSDEAMALAGFSPAPGYVENTSTYSKILNSYSQLYGNDSTAFSEVERRNKWSQLKQAFLQAQKTKSPKDAQAYTMLKDQYEAAYPQYLGQGGKAVERGEKAWEKPRGFLMFQRLPRQVQMQILKDAPPEERAVFGMAVHKDMREMYPPPDPQEFQKFSANGQANFLKALKKEDREDYLYFAKPEVAAQFQE
jgi:hypothetical protein